MTFDNSYNPLNVRMAAEKYQHTARRLRENPILVSPATCVLPRQQGIQQAIERAYDS